MTPKQQSEDARSDILSAMVLAGVNSIVAVGCLVIWAVIAGALSW